jgi:hypothetical protein
MLANSLRVNSQFVTFVSIIDDHIPSPERTSMRSLRNVHFFILLCLTPAALVQAEVLYDCTISTPQPAEISSFFFSASESELAELKNTVYPPRPGRNDTTETAAPLPAATAMPGLATLLATPLAAGLVDHPVDLLQPVRTPDKLTELIKLTGLNSMSFQQSDTKPDVHPGAADHTSPQSTAAPASGTPETPPQAPAEPRRTVPAIHLRRPVLLSGK